MIVPSEVMLIITVPFVAFACFSWSTSFKKLLYKSSHVGSMPESEKEKKLKILVI
jgi:hypothetical protein